ncbi:membrane protein [Metabacillus indicus]|uniref:Membrane protein n=2 Tax=Metabacillus indicus TaxID=246786 RepID=A0A084H192_METID|nr:membrane protein [Metabacillus indicus]
MLFNRHYFGEGIHMTARRKNLLSGILFGLGLVAFIDETIFHQLLHWHHFYDKETTDIGLISDGLFHAFSWFATIGGLFMFADLRRRQSLIVMRWTGGVLAGAGAFQLYDGTIQHKLMGLHQIRYVENVYIYDWIWNVTAVLMLLSGMYFILREKRKQAG